MNHLPEAIVALQTVKGLVGVFPSGDKLGAGVELAIELCKSIQTMRFNPQAYAELGLKASSLLTSIIHALQKADATCIPKILIGVDSSIRVCEEVREFVGTRATTTDKKSEFLRHKRQILAKQEKDAITGLEQKIEDIVVQLQALCDMRLEVTTHMIPETVERIAWLRTNEAELALLQQLAPIHTAGHNAADLKIATCLEQTRVALLTDLHSWLIQRDGPQLFWLNGSAGTGKSTIARTFCERTAHDVYLASFFISQHAADRRDALGIFHTLVYQLALRNQDMRQAVCEVLRAEAGLLQEGLRSQISKLLPPLLLHVPIHAQVLIVIDALDECDKDDYGRAAGELIPLLMRTLRAAPQRAHLLITSRDGFSIQDMFCKVTSDAADLCLHDIDNSLVQDDLRLYFRYHLRRIALQNTDLRADDWPGKTAFEELLYRTGLLFVYAATVVRFLDNPAFDSSEQLQRILSEDARSAVGTYRMLDTLYTTVLATVPSFNGGLETLEDNMIDRVRRLVGTIVCLQQTLPVNDIVALMGLNEYETRQTLAQLGAVLAYEHDGPVRVLHPSFPNFLADPSRCVDARFRLDPSERNSEITFRCLVLMNKRLRYDICGTGKPWLRNDEMVHQLDASDDLGSLRYACMYWAAHLTRAGAPDSRLTNELASFCNQHLLHWIELCSLMGKTSHIDKYLTSALEWCQAYADAYSITKVMTLLNDARRFWRTYRMPIKSHALHTYSSGLVTMPQCPLITHIPVSSSVMLPQLISPRHSSWGPDVQVLLGHTSSIRSVGFSPTGKQVVSGSDDMTVRIWDAQRGTELCVLQDHTSSVTSVAFSPDGKHVVSGSDDETIRIWDLRAGAELCVLRGHNSRVSSVAFSPDGNQVVSASDIDTLRIWDVQMGTEVCVLQGHNDSLSSVAFSMDGRKVVSGSYDKTIHIWDVHTGNKVRVIDGHDDSVSSVSFSPDGMQVVSASDDHTVRIWDAEKGTELRVFRGHTGPVLSVAFSPNGQQVVSGSYDETIRIWDVQTETQMRALHGHKSLISSVAFSPCGEQIVSGSIDETVCIWNTPLGIAESDVLQSHRSRLSYVAFSPDGTQVATSSDDNTIRIWDAQTGSELNVLQGGKAQDRHSSRMHVASEQIQQALIRLQTLYDDRPAFSLSELGWLSCNLRLSEREDLPLPLLWLPFERRGSALAAFGYRVAIGSSSGLLSILDFTKVLTAQTLTTDSPPLMFNNSDEIAKINTRFTQALAIVSSTSEDMIDLVDTSLGLTRAMIEELEGHIKEGAAAQAVIDVLDQALLAAEATHPAYGSGVRHIRRWCRNFALLPSSFTPIEIQEIQLESEEAQISTGFSDVHRGAFSGKTVAVKSLRVYGLERSLPIVQKMFHSEVVAWRYLKHPNIVPFLGVCDKSPVCLVSEWMQEGTLSDFFDRHPDETRTSYILGMVRGLEFMHSLKIVHGDIKAINVLVDSDRNARLADFGLVSFLNNATSVAASLTGDSGGGTLRYMAPEIIDPKNAAEANGTSLDRSPSDVYALTITIWEVFTGQTPFADLTAGGVLLKVIEGKRPGRPLGCEGIGFNDQLWDIMEQGWDQRPEKRPKLSAFVEILDGAR